MPRKPKMPEPTRIGDSRLLWGSKTYVTGVINVTPDSFSGDGLGSDVDSAIRLGKSFQEWGADMVDVGGESTRPSTIYTGAAPASEEVELARVLPVIEALVAEIDIPVSIDTHKADVARRAIDAGAAMVNDQWALARDPDIGHVAAEAGVPVVLMHNQEGTEYRDLVPDVLAALQRAIDRATAAGVAFEDIIVDPGMGFGKTAEHNLELLRRVDELDVLGRPVLVGMSRKSTIGYVLDLPVEERVEGTAATVAFSVAAGADVVRVHDVKEMVRVARMSDAIVRGWSRA